MTPRIEPGDRAAIGTLSALIARVLGLAAGGGPPNVFTTLARHRRLFRPWLRFAGRLMPGGVLPRIDAELVILRVAHIAGSEYEWRHHERLGAAAGLTLEEIARVRIGPDDPSWDDRRRALLTATDELLWSRDITDATWSSLQAHLDERGLIELCMLAGHYEMLAMTLNALRVQPDVLPDQPPLIARTIQSLVARRG